MRKMLVVMQQVLKDARCRKFRRSGQLREIGSNLISSFLLMTTVATTVAESISTWESIIDVVTAIGSSSCILSPFSAPDADRGGRQTDMALQHWSNSDRESMHPARVRLEAASLQYE